MHIHSTPSHPLCTRVLHALGELIDHLRRDILSKETSLIVDEEGEAAMEAAVSALGDNTIDNKTPIDNFTPRCKCNLLEDYILLDRCTPLDVPLCLISHYHIAVVCAVGEGWGGSASASGSSNGSSVVAGAAAVAVGSSSGGLSISHLDQTLTDEEVLYD